MSAVSLSELVLVLVDGFVSLMGFFSVVISLVSLLRVLRFSDLIYLAICLSQWFVVEELPDLSMDVLYEFYLT